MHDPESHVVIIGGGPAGLTAGYLLARDGWRVSIFETDSYHLGGLAKTVSHKGFRFDIGGHRLDSRSAAVNDLWAEVLGPDLIERPRLSKLCYRGKIFPYPTSAADLLPKLGLQEAVLSGLSYLKTKISPPAAAPAKSFEDWGKKQFGGRVFEKLFENYARKSWDGAAEPSRNNNPVFRYPRLGPGHLWERCGDEIRACGGSIYLGHTVMAMEQNFDRIWTIDVRTNKGRDIQFRAANIITTTDIRELIHMIQPTVSAEAALAAGSLHYRDFLNVSLIVRDFRNLPEQTLDLYDPDIKAARLQNYKAWSEEMVPDPAYASYGLEYFRPHEDGLWDMDDRALLAFAASELEKTGLARASEVADGLVVRISKACPIYSENYGRNIQTIRKDIAERYHGLHFAGRNGMHKAHNLDQAMLTGMLTARNIMAGENRHDIWEVNPAGELRTSRTTMPRPTPAPGPQPIPAAAAPASASGLRLVHTNKSRTAEQLAALERQVSAFRGPAPHAVGIFKVHAGGASGKHPAKKDENKNNGSGNDDGPSAA